MKITYWTPAGNVSFSAISAKETRTGIRFTLPDKKTKTVSYTALISISDTQNLSDPVKLHLPQGANNSNSS